ncbi:type IV secretory system conjugative DNA transfer family protein [Streptomyces durmitorensis]|uniref:Type IV secretory system conjugative DNA transfer family protein n=1 Tax=Streptomyces durmitorensis TaxID=319947 RepID=A0ABY4PXU2_9ACTN|nr:type IV secretory system conjugative DNA transfer family protein [Streptomyces durmitorensis]UQT57688.1 type IV secretory system conjugative DNA transfer family protein [Streptomyces durmitorensis]
MGYREPEPDDRYRGGRRESRERGIPDGVLVGGLAFVLGLTVLVWSSTGLAGLFSHGSWPKNVTFGNTPVAMRHLVQQPHDIVGAWPATPAAQLTGYGLFWGLLIGQLMVLVVLTIFVMGTVTRWRAVRRARREERLAPAPQTQAPAEAAPVEAVPAPAPAVGRRSAGRNGWAQPTSQGADEQDIRAAAVNSTEMPSTETATVVPTPRTPLVLGPQETRRPLAAEAIRDAEGAALVLTSDPTLWEETKDARAKLGPVLVYDPSHLCDTPARMHWSPTTNCEDKATAAQRATALLAAIRPSAKLDSTVADTAETLLRSFLHAAAVDGRPVKHVHRWAQGTGVQDAVRILRTHQKAAAGAAGELEAALTAYPERRDMAQELTARALSALFTLNVRESCTPNRTDALTLDSFIDEGGTLFVVGEAIEDPKSPMGPGAMPLLTALASSVVEHGRRMAERSSSGRLDPPMTLVLDDVAAVAPLPQLPELLSTGADRGLPTLALLRSREQARTRWPHAELPG